MLFDRIFICALIALAILAPEALGIPGKKSRRKAPKPTKAQPAGQSDQEPTPADLIDRASLPPRVDGDQSLGCRMTSAFDSENTEIPAPDMEQIVNPQRLSRLPTLENLEDVSMDVPSLERSHSGLRSNGQSLNPSPRHEEPFDPDDQLSERKDSEELQKEVSLYASRKSSREPSRSPPRSRRASFIPDAEYRLPRLPSPELPDRLEERMPSLKNEFDESYRQFDGLRDEDEQWTEAAQDYQLQERRDSPLLQRENSIPASLQSSRSRQQSQSPVSGRREYELPGLPYDQISEDFGETAYHVPSPDGEIVAAEQPPRSRTPSPAQIIAEEEFPTDAMTEPSSYAFSISPRRHEPSEIEKIVDIARIARDHSYHCKDDEEMVGDLENQLMGRSGRPIEINLADEKHRYCFPWLLKYCSALSKADINAGQASFAVEVVSAKDMKLLERADVGECKAKLYLDRDIGTDVDYDEELPLLWGIVSKFRVLRLTLPDLDYVLGVHWGSIMKLLSAARDIERLYLGTVSSFRKAEVISTIERNKIALKRLYIGGVPVQLANEQRS